MKRKILIYCNNYLGFTLLSSGGVLEDLVAAFDVTILTSESAESTIRTVAGPNCRVIGESIKPKRVQTALYGFIGDVLGMGYAADGDRRNMTGVLHRAAHLQLAKKKSFLERLRKNMVVWLSERAEYSALLRKMLNRLFYLFSTKADFAGVLKDINPILCIATTAGLGRDGVFFAASHQAGISCLALIQSWDRTASKGYPAHHPDFCIVWNNAMRYEAKSFLEIPEQGIFVEGAPPWDAYLSKNSPLNFQEKEDFFQKWNLDPAKKLIFVALNGGATHEENHRLIRDLCAAHERGDLPDTQIMFRSHPAYLIDPVRTQELKNVFEELKNPDLHLMHPIVVNPLNKDYVVTEDDRIFMHTMFRACDITVSIMSTWMIESAIFDKPNICIEYGRYITQLYDFQLSDYNAEHLMRIFSYGAIHRVRSPEDMVQTVNRVLKNPSELSVQRAKLAEAETGPHKGNARKAFLNRIVKITEAL